MTTVSVVGMVMIFSIRRHRVIAKPKRRQERSFENPGAIKRKGRLLIQTTLSYSVYF